MVVLASCFYKLPTSENQITGFIGNPPIILHDYLYGVPFLLKGTGVALSSSKEGRKNIKDIAALKCSQSASGQSLPNAVHRQMVRHPGKKEYHLWKSQNSSSSGGKALDLVRIVSGLPNEKEAVYEALDKWTAWETEFPVIAAAKALKLVRKRNQWVRLIQVGKWMLSKGQGMTMGTYDSLLLAFDMDHRIEEAETLWNMILHTHTRSLSKQLFSRMISLYDHHNMPAKIIEVFADMEELGVRPDDSTIKRVLNAFHTQGQEEKQKLILEKYRGKWKYMNFKGERVRVKID